MKLDLLKRNANTTICRTGSESDVIVGFLWSKSPTRAGKKAMNKNCIKLRLKSYDFPNHSAVRVESGPGTPFHPFVVLKSLLLIVFALLMMLHID